ncbi:MAG: hypothetical protein FWG90_10135 [Oscillospiraceae bacterium]|nr:hypothetical protein [Oscillospiraceae bacterium]
MLNNKAVKVIDLYEKPIELMTDEEKDADYMLRFGMTYDEFYEYYKDDTPESLDKELDDFIAARIM